MTVVLSVLPSSVTLEHVEALQSCIALLLQSPLGGVVVVTFGKTAVLSVLLMTTVLSVLPSSPVTLGGAVVVTFVRLRSCRSNL